MKFFHLSDLHLGKMVHGYSMIEMKDQIFWIEQLLEKADRHQPDAILIAGDVYDRAVPSKEAVKLFDHLLTEFANRNIPVLIIAGNHDSGSRLAFADRLLCRQGIHICGEIQKEIPSIAWKDAYGTVRFWLLPYVFPAAVNAILGREDLKEYDGAVRALIDFQKINEEERNVILAHQFVVAGQRKPEMGGSETTVGGIGQVDASVFEKFDYVALGHIHNAQCMGGVQIRYGGSPICYHFSEAGQNKGLTIVELKEKGTLTVNVEEMKVLHQMRNLTGTVEEILQEAVEENSYIKATIRQEMIPPGTVELLRNHFEAKNCILMEVVREHFIKGTINSAEKLQNVKQMSLEQLFSEFYKSQYNGEFLEEDMEKIVQFAAEQTRNGAEEESEKEKEESMKKLIEYASKVMDKGDCV